MDQKNTIFSKKIFKRRVYQTSSSNRRSVLQSIQLLKCIPQSLRGLYAYQRLSTRMWVVACLSGNGQTCGYLPDSRRLLLPIIQ